MKKLTEYQKDVLLEWGRAWLDYYEKTLIYRNNMNSAEFKHAHRNCRECEIGTLAIAQALQVECSLVDHRFIVSTKKDGELFSWGI